MDPFSIAFGVANAGMGLFGAFSGQAQQNAQIEAQNEQNRINTETANKQAVERYKNQLYISDANYTREGSLYTYNQFDVRQQLYQNQLAASKAYNSQQIRMNELLRQSRFEEQNRSIQEAQAVGKVQAKGQVGRSAARAEALTRAMFGRDRAISSASLKSASNASERANRTTYQQLRIANDTANKSLRGAAPVMANDTLAPTMRSYSQQGPAPTPWGAIGQSVLGGVTSSYEAYKGEWFQ